MTTKITKSSGNVYADLEEHALKAELVRQIAAVKKDEKLTQTDAVQRLGFGRSDVSKMLRGHFRQFSVDRLMHFLRSWQSFRCRHSNPVIMKSRN